MVRRVLCINNVCSWLIRSGGWCSYRENSPSLFPARCSTWRVPSLSEMFPPRTMGTLYSLYNVCNRLRVLKSFISTGAYWQFIVNPWLAACWQIISCWYLLTVLLSTGAYWQFVIYRCFLTVSCLDVLLGFDTFYCLLLVISDSSLSTSACWQIISCWYL